MSPKIILALREEFYGLVKTEYNNQGQEHCSGGRRQVQDAGRRDRIEQLARAVSV